MSREAVLHRVRTALRRSVGGAAPAPPPVLFDEEARVDLGTFRARIEALGGFTYSAAHSGQVRDLVESILKGRSAVASNAPLLAQCGVTEIEGVESGFTDGAALRARISVCDAGITGADYALADTGTLVMLSSPTEARAISLLPPIHVAVVARSRVLPSLDSLLSIAPNPAELSSSMVLITGPSRTADIEMILVRGVHGPGQIHVIVIEDI